MPNGSGSRPLLACMKPRPSGFTATVIARAFRVGRLMTRRRTRAHSTAYCAFSEVLNWLGRGQNLRPVPTTGQILPTDYGPAHIAYTALGDMVVRIATSRATDASWSGKGSRRHCNACTDRRPIPSTWGDTCTRPCGFHDCNGRRHGDWVVDGSGRTRQQARRSLAHRFA